MHQFAEAGRRTDWIHIPTLDTTDETFYAPLVRLVPGGARIYLGMIHNMHTSREWLTVARKFVSDFGLSAYCGFGRNPAEQLPQILGDHLHAVELLKMA